MESDQFQNRYMSDLSLLLTIYYFLYLVPVMSVVRKAIILRIYNKLLYDSVCTCKQGESVIL